MNTYLIPNEDTGPMPFSLLGLSNLYIYPTYKALFDVVPSLARQEPSYTIEILSAEQAALRAMKGERLYRIEPLADDHPFHTIHDLFDQRDDLPTTKAAQQFGGLAGFTSLMADAEYNRSEGDEPMAYSSADIAAAMASMLKAVDVAEIDRTI